MKLAFHLLLTLLTAVSLAVSPDAYAGPRTPGSGDATSATPTATPRRTSSTSASSPRSTPTSRNWGNRTSSARPASSGNSAADRSLAAKVRQTDGAFNKTSSAAFPSTPSPAPVGSSTNNYDRPATSPAYSANMSRPAIPTTLQRPVTPAPYRATQGPFIPVPVVTNNRSQPFSGYSTAPAQAPFSTAGLGMIFFKTLLFVALLGGLAAGGYFLWQYLQRRKKEASLKAAEDMFTDKPLTTPGFDAHLPDEWSKVQAGSLLTLSDPLTGLTGKEFIVSKVGTLTQNQALGRWRFFSFEDEPNVQFLVKTVDNDIALSRLERTDVEPLTRQELLDQNLGVFFAPPADEANFSADDLRYTPQFDAWDNNDHSNTTTYVQKSQGELHGRYSVRPAPSGQSVAQKCTIVEYAAAGGENPDPLRTNLIILETGAGLVETFLAGPVKFSEVNVEIK